MDDAVRTFLTFLSQQDRGRIVVMEGENPKDYFDTEAAERSVALGLARSDVGGAWSYWEISYVIKRAGRIAIGQTPAPTIFDRLRKLVSAG